MRSLLSILFGSSVGAVLRWQLGNYCNHIFPTVPLGTLAANLLGSLLMGSVIFFTLEHSFLSYNARLGIITGFLGSLTTFSTFSAEALLLFSKQEFFWLAALILLHVGGSILMVGMGYALSMAVFKIMGG